MHEKMPPSGEEEEAAELATTVLTCEGDLRDPSFPSRLKSLLCRLQRLISDDEHPLCVQKIEPWNSVRVTFSIPSEAAQRLRQLAQQGDEVLRQLGILSVQIQGDQVITLTLAGRYGDSQEIVLRKSPEPSEPATQQALASQSCAQNSVAGDASRIPRRPSAESSVAVALAAGGGCMLESLPGPSSMEATRKNIVQYLSQQGTCAAAAASAPQQRRPSTTGSALAGEAAVELAFRSPNVVAPANTDLPFSAARTNKSNMAANFGPFPFASMQHAINTKHSSSSSSSSSSHSSSSHHPPVPPGGTHTPSTSTPSLVSSTSTVVVSSSVTGTSSRPSPYPNAFAAAASSLLCTPTSSASPGVVNSVFSRTCTPVLNNVHSASRVVGGLGRPNIALSSPLLVNLLKSDAAAAVAAGSGSGSCKMLPPPAPDDGPTTKRKRKPRKPRVDKLSEGESPQAVSPACITPASPHLTAATTTQHASPTYTTSIINSGNNLNPSAFIKMSSASGATYELSKLHSHTPHPDTKHIISHCKPQLTHAQPMADTENSLAPVGVPPVALPLPFSTQPNYSVPRVLHSSNLGSRETVKVHSTHPVANTNADPVPPIDADAVRSNSDGKTKHLINPITGHLEPMPSDEEDESVDSLPLFPEGELDTSENGGQSEHSPSDGGKDNLSSDTDSGISKSHTDISQSSTDVPLENSIVVTTAVTEESTSIVSQQREIKLRLKFKESDGRDKRTKGEGSPLAGSGTSASARVDVSFVNIPGVQKNSVLLPPEPKVPPLHISLRGPNSAVVVSPRKDDRLRDADPYHLYSTSNMIEQRKCRPVGSRGPVRSLNSELCMGKGSGSGRIQSAGSQREHRRGSKNGCQVERTKDQKLLSALHQGSEKQAKSLITTNSANSSPQSPQEPGSDPSSSGGLTDPLDSSPESSKTVLHVIKDEVLPLSHADFKLNTFEVRNCRARSLSLDSLKSMKDPISPVVDTRQGPFLNKRRQMSVVQDGPDREDPQVSPVIDPLRLDPGSAETILSRADCNDFTHDTNKSVLQSTEPVAVCNHLPHSRKEQDFRHGSEGGSSKFLTHQQEKGRIIFTMGRRLSDRSEPGSETPCSSYHQSVVENHVSKENNTDEKETTVSSARTTVNRSSPEKHTKACKSHLVLCNQVDANYGTKLELTPRNSLENHCGGSGKVGEVLDDASGNVAKSVLNDQHCSSGFSNQFATSNCKIYEGYASLVVNNKTKVEPVLNHQDSFKHLSSDHLHNNNNNTSSINNNNSNKSSSDASNSLSPSPSQPESLCLVNMNHSSSPMAKIFSIDSHTLKQVIEVPSVCLTAAAAATTCGGLVPKTSLVKSNIKLDNSMLPLLIPSVGDVFCESLGGSDMEDHFMRVGDRSSSPIVHHTKLVTIASDSLNLHTLKFGTTAAVEGIVQDSEKVSADSSNTGEGVCGGLKTTSCAIRTGFGDSSDAPVVEKVVENGNALSSEESSLDSELSERDSPPGGQAVEKPRETSSNLSTEKTTEVTSSGSSNCLASDESSTQVSTKVCSVVVYEEEEEDEEGDVTTKSDIKTSPSHNLNQDSESLKQNGPETTVETTGCLVSKPEGFPSEFQDTALASEPTIPDSDILHFTPSETPKSGQTTPAANSSSQNSTGNASTPVSTVDDRNSNQSHAEISLKEIPKKDEESAGTENSTQISPLVESHLEKQADASNSTSEDHIDPASTTVTEVAATKNTPDSACTSPYAKFSVSQSSTFEKTVHSQEEVATSFAHPCENPSPAQVILPAGEQETTVDDQKEGHKISPPVTATSTVPSTSAVTNASTLAGLNVLSCNRGVFGSSEANKVTLIFKSATAATGHQLTTQQGPCNSPSSLVKPKSVPIKLVALPPSCGSLVAGRPSGPTFFEIIGQTSSSSNSSNGSPGPSGGSPVRLVVKSSSPQASPRTTVVVKSVVVAGGTQSLKLLPATSTAARVSIQTDSISSSASSSNSSALSVSSPTLSLLSCSAIGSVTRQPLQPATPQPSSPSKSPSPDSEMQNGQTLHDSTKTGCTEKTPSAPETMPKEHPVAQDVVKDAPSSMQDASDQEEEQNRTPAASVTQCDLSSPQRTGGVSDSDVVVVVDEFREAKVSSDCLTAEAAEEKCTVPVSVRPNNSPPPPELNEEPVSETHLSVAQESVQPTVEPVLVDSKPLIQKSLEDSMDFVKSCVDGEEKRPVTRSSSSSDLLQESDSKVELSSLNSDSSSNLNSENKVKEEPNSETDPKLDHSVVVEDLVEIKIEDPKTEVKHQTKVTSAEEIKESPREVSCETTRSSSRSSSRAEETLPNCKTEASESTSECSSDDELSLSELAIKNRALSGPLAIALAAERPATTSPSTRHSRSVLRKRKLEQQLQSSSAQQSEESEVEYLYTTQVSSNCRSSSNESRSSNSRLGAEETNVNSTSTTTAGRTRSSKRVRTAETRLSPLPRNATAVVRNQRVSKRTSGRETLSSRLMRGTVVEATEAPSSLALTGSNTTGASVTAPSPDVDLAAMLASSVASILSKEEVVGQRTEGKRKTRSGSATTEQPNSTMPSSNMKRRRVSKDFHR